MVVYTRDIPVGADYSVSAEDATGLRVKRYRLYIVYSSCADLVADLDYHAPERVKLAVHLPGIGQLAETVRSKRCVHQGAGWSPPGHTHLNAPPNGLKQRMIVRSRCKITRLAQAS